MLDLRLPMGMMFGLVGAMLVIYGASTNSDSMYQTHSLGINVNLWWGAVLVVFGLAMLGMAKMAAAKEKAAQGEPK